MINGMKNITVIIPVYNAESTIERTLASLISNKEYIQDVILVDDRTTDNTFDKIDNFKPFFNITVLKNTGEKGPGPARKTGLLYAKTEWITFLDADDCLTPNSLRYVDERLDDDIVLLHCKTIYYESGIFNQDTISFCDMSCGGNFYRLKYLIKNKLFPHETLYMSEDEYFNNIIKFYIENFEKNHNSMIGYFDYPVYEVHHDIEDRGSFAFDHWAEYIVKYHLLYNMYVLDFFKFKLKMRKALYDEYVSGIIFGYFLFEGVLMDTSVETDYISSMEFFSKAIDKYEKYFKKSRQELVDYFYNESNKDKIQGLLESAWGSIGFEFSDYMSFEEFIDKLDLYRE